MDHSLLPAVQSASLPARYEAAKVALRDCHHIDECKDWSDKAAALASYARQADDKELEQTAMRIRARAIRRCGELLKEIEAKHGTRTDLQHRGSGSPMLTRKAAAEAAGLSADQAKDAIRVANVPEDDFEAQVDSDNPPTITSLADQGIVRHTNVPIYEQLNMTEAAFRAGMHCGSSIKYFAIELAKYNPQDVADGLTPDDREAVRSSIKTIQNVLTELLSLL